MKLLKVEQSILLEIPIMKIMNTHLAIGSMVNGLNYQVDILQRILLFLMGMSTPQVRQMEHVIG